MARFSATSEGLIAFSLEKEAQRDLEEQKQTLELEELKKTEYRRLRAAEYPPMADYLDGVVKQDQAQIDKYISDCLAVKAKYPKPI